MGTTSSTSTPPPRPWLSLLDADAWRTQGEHAAQQMRAQLMSARSVALYETMTRHAVDASTGGVLFWLGISAAQLVQRAVRISASTPIAPRVVGTLAVASSSVLALHFASFPREAFDVGVWSLNAQKEKAVDWTRVARDVLAKLQLRAQDVSNAPFTVYMAMGVLSFKMLGGRMSSLAPSHYANLGAFHLRKASLPATELYAGTTERGIIQEFGRLFGCHTCGAKNAAKYHGDHMPPKLVAARINKSLWRKITGKEVGFRFYPQCSGCSNQQGAIVKAGRDGFKTHLGSLRLYHTTGFWLVLLCTGGLYFGGSTFHETADVHQAQPRTHQAANSSQSETPVEEDQLKATSADYALLVALRDRERRLRRERRSKKLDAATASAMDAELKALEESKRRLKASLKYQHK